PRRLHRLRPRLRLPAGRSEREGAEHARPFGAMEMSNGKPRGSVFGAMFLVIIGTLFLVHNFRPDLIRWNLLGRWWPVLLIIWGVVRLIENLAGTGRRGVTGGEVFLLVILIVAGIGISFASRIPGVIRIDDAEDLPFGESADVTQELPPRDLPPGTLVRINTGQ